MLFRIVNLDSTSRGKKELGRIRKTVIQRVKIVGATRPLASSSVGIAIGSWRWHGAIVGRTAFPCRLAGRFEIQSTSGPCCKIVNRIPRSLPRLAVVAVVTRVGQFLSVFPREWFPIRCSMLHTRIRFVAINSVVTRLSRHFVPHFSRHLCQRKIAALRFL